MEIVLPARAGRYFSTPCRVINESNQLEKSFEAVCQNIRVCIADGAAAHATSACRFANKTQSGSCVLRAGARYMPHLRFVRSG